MYNDIKHKFTGRSLKVKTFRSIICLVFVFALALTAVSCGNKPAGQTDDTTVAAVKAVAAPAAAAAGPAPTATASKTDASRPASAPTETAMRRIS